MDNAPRTALLAGATGLVGRALLSLLLASNHYRSVHVLLRRTPPDIEANAKLEIHQIDFARLPATFPKVDDVFIALGTTIKIAGSEGAFRQVDFDFGCAHACNRVSQVPVNQSLLSASGAWKRALRDTNLGSRATRHSSVNSI